MVWFLRHGVLLGFSDGTATEDAYMSLNGDVVIVSKSVFFSGFTGNSGTFLIASMH